MARPSLEQWSRGRVTTNMSRSADGGFGRHISQQAAPAIDSVFRHPQGLAAMSHRSISGTSAAPLRAPATAEVLVVARSRGVSAATTSTSSRTEKGMRARRRSRYSREPCAERRKQPTLKKRRAEGHDDAHQAISAAQLAHLPHARASLGSIAPSLQPRRSRSGADLSFASLRRHGRPRPHPDKR